MMPHVRKPVSASTRWFIPCHSRRLSITSGISRGSRAILRHQPQLRLQFSPAMWPFSHSTVETPFSARNSAALAPIMPPPIITTSARAGRVSSVTTGSTRGAISHLRNGRFGAPILAGIKYPDSREITGGERPAPFRHLELQGFLGNSLRSEQRIAPDRAGKCFAQTGIEVVVTHRNFGAG